MSFLLLLIIIFIVVPIIRVAITFHRLKRNARQAFESMYGRAYSSGNRQADREDVTRPPKRKKIERDVGEYVAFEELPPNPDAARESASRSAKAVIEQQVVDAEWEEIH